MTTNYQRNRERRRLDNERRTLGETLGEYHARERPVVQLGDRIPRGRCSLTPSLLDGLRDNKTTHDLFDQPTKGK